ncbi:MAG: hypothetical protein UHS51_05600 [Atopobiaceae bacterium]|jgi:hypothetical protein|nr:hypothetical protein [Atopobiaceae bacterium]
MAEMVTSEFVSKVLNDKDFLTEVCESIPEELLQKEHSEGRSDFGRAVSVCLYGASRVMGFGFDEDEFATEWKRQIDELKGAAKMHFAARFIRLVVSGGGGRAK